MSIKEQFERDIIKKYRPKLWARFIRALQDYKMIEEGDTVGVAISGGKDSLLLAKLLQEVKLHGDFDFNLVFISMDPGFSEENRQLIIHNCELLGIPVNLIRSDVFEVANKLDPNRPCYMCAKMRRGFLYTKAKEFGCNKLALGHHFDDVIETTMLNILYAGCFKTMVPKVKAENFEDITLIRPMIYIHEEDIRKIMKSNDITCMTCGCRIAANELPSKRREIKHLIKDLKQVYPIVDQNIFKSAQNVNLNAILGYKDENQYFDFNDIFERGKKQ